VQNVLKRIGDIRAEITTYVSVNKITLTAKKDKIASLNATIDELREIIKEDSKPIKTGKSKKPYEESPFGEEFLGVVGESLVSMAKPFIFLGRKLSQFFKWVSGHGNEFSAFIRKIATQPAFWVALLFAIVNGSFSHRLFDDMFTDTLMVLMFTGICTSVFSILPFHVSKHIKECSENPNRATKTLLTFESTLASLVAIAYPILTSQHSHIYAESEQTQFVAATAVGLLPIVTACIIGFMNYWKLKGNGETPTLTDVIETIVSEVTDQSAETEPQPSTDTDSVVGNDTGDDHEEDNINTEVNHHE
jgi:branched-subunit amino acid transport protein